MRRVLVVHPGSFYSTVDVWEGLCGGLEANGVEVVRYEMGGRLQEAHSWLQHAWEWAGKPAPKPAMVDAQYKASVDALERALYFNCDAVLVVSAILFHPDALMLMRRAGLPIGIVFTESPYDDAKQLKLLPFVDAAWVNERSSLARFQERHMNVHYLPAAYDPTRHFPGKEFEDEVPTHDVVFVGVGFPERIKLLRGVDWSGIDVGIYGDWMLLGKGSSLRHHWKDGIVSNEFTSGLYRKAKIGLNLHRRTIGYGHRNPQITWAESLNPRAYELAACGCFHLSDWRREVTETFGEYVPTFKTSADLERLIRTFLDDPARREAYAIGARETIAPNTFTARARQILAEFELGSAQTKELVGVGSHG